MDLEMNQTLGEIIFFFGEMMNDEISSIGDNSENTQIYPIMDDEIAEAYTIDPDEPYTLTLTETFDVSGQFDYYIQDCLSENTTASMVFM